MWAAILALVSKILDIFRSKQEKEKKEFDLKQTEEFKVQAKKQEQVNRTDENEKLVADANSKDAAKAQAALEAIRVRLGK